MSDHRVRVICDGPTPGSHEPYEVTRLDPKQAKFGHYSRRCCPRTATKAGREVTVWTLSCPTCRRGDIVVPEKHVPELSRLLLDGGLISGRGGGRSVSTRMIRGLLDRLAKGREPIMAGQ